MDDTVKILVDKVTQLINLYNSMGNNSKKIHELSDLNENQELLIAVSDGESTGKVIYKPNQVSSEDFDNLSALKLKADINSSTLYIEDGDGTVLTTLDISFLNGNNVTLNVDSATQTLQLLNYNDEVISSVELSDLAPEVQPKQKAIHVHTLTPADVSQATITLDLVNVPDVSEFYDLHVNGVYVNDDDYIVQGNQVIIAKSNIAYEVQAGMKLTFRYRYV